MGAEERGQLVSRRLLLKYAGAGAATLLVARHRGFVPGGTTATLIDAQPLSLPGGPGFVTRVVRPADMLAVDFTFVNLKVVSSPSGPQLTRVDLNTAAHVVVGFPPQAVLEEAFVDGSPLPFFGDVRAKLAAPSRLGFTLPSEVHQIPYRLDALLDWAPLDSNSLTPGTIGTPGANQTAIEAPWGLVLTPDPETTTWAHPSAPVTSNGRTELWRTNLVRRVEPDVPEVRAVEAKGVGDDFPAPLTLAQRRQIVHATSEAGALARPAKATRMALSALGASLSLDGSWEGLQLAGWRHRSTHGRDHYVKVDEVGYLLPLGHKAVLVTVSERQFRGGGAYLFRREFLVVKSPVKTYPTGFEVDGGRRWPFRTVRLTTSVTPSITRGDYPSGTTSEIFIPFVDGSPFQFGVEALDAEGRVSSFSMPLAFIFETAGDAYREGGLLAAGAYNQVSESSRRRSLGGRSVALAPPSTPGDTTMEVSSVLFDATRAGGDEAGLRDAGQPIVLPVIATAQVRLPSAEAILGDAVTQPEVTFADAYLSAGDDGFGAGNAGSVFLQLAQPLDLGLPADKAGGLAAPKLAIEGLSRQFGSVGDLAGIVDGKFNPKEYFDPDAKLLGSLSLRDIVKDVSDAVTEAQKVPKLLTTRLPDRVETVFTWTPDLQDVGPFRIKDGTSLAVEVKITAAGTGVTSRVEGLLQAFDLAMPPPETEPAPPDFDPAIRLVFKRIRFVSENGAKPDLDVALDDVVFGGPLKFVDDLRRFLKTPGSGLAIDVAPTGIDAGYSLALPAVAVGVFAMQNIALNAGVSLPFDDRPVAARFAFCTREKPFLMTYSLFAGGGFVGIRVSSRGLEVLEASLEFGAATSLNLGVASGSVSAMAGIYFKLHQATDSVAVVLSGYVRLNGSLEVLGLITVSVEFYMSLTYDSQSEKLTGRATLTMKVKVAFFSKSVSLSVERRFGGGGDPPFGIAISAGDWDRYCNAFAVEAA